ncbi:isovaleryl-CoA dehydrogenase [Salicibibacter halophilus]|uniref:Isovaleryl-CoA dehydrogenase n=1 Tax=Salicibibacter halophilus TaxID=2502791 RepID=A0A514LIN0_9BACI|nr:acyl-CoA dehydrogenase family protein [Salicibibacter halophilus]QDI91708.1 isovaleryl-CoA dehydrogenase [Salicibibacter halophilus]
MPKSIQDQKGIDYTKWEAGNDANWYDDDPILQRYAERYLSESMLKYVQSDFSRTGQLAAESIDRRAVHTDRDGAPKLIRYNRKGEEINEVWYNEGYLQTVKDGYGTGVVSYRYDEHAPEQVPFMVNAILLYMLCEAESGFTCPVGLSQSAAFVLEKFGSEKQQQDYLSLLTTTDPELHQEGGTFLTEIQGGSDVGATETKAVKQGDHYLLSGEKWFASNCDAEVAITLARVNDQPSTRGLGLFLMPRTLPDGSRNNVSIRRLKDKLGVRAVASGELELNGAVGYLIGEEGKGFKYMAEALNVSRLGTALSGIAIARRAFLEAVIYTGHRNAFGQTINSFPMVQETLVQMITAIEAGWAIVAQTIRKFDEIHTYGKDSKEDYALMRILLSLAKYRGSDLGVSVAKEAIELHGGNGYIEEYVTPRLLRDAVVNPVWEGTANIQALEVVKTLNKGGAEPFTADLKRTLNRIDSPTLQNIRQQLANEVSQLESLMEQLLNTEEHGQQAAAKKLADFMYDLYAAVHLLEEAQHDLEHKGDDRRAEAANQWMKMKFKQPSDRGIFADDINENVFRKLVCFQ